MSVNVNFRRGKKSLYAAFDQQLLPGELLITAVDGYQQQSHHSQLLKELMIQLIDTDCGVDKVRVIDFALIAYFTGVQVEAVENAVKVAVEKCDSRSK